MIKINIKPEWKTTAKEMSEDMGVLNHSIMRGAGNFAGFLGELVVANYLGVELCHTYDYDLIYDDKKVDVKTKQCTSPPKPHYECSIANYNHTQRCDEYIFVRIEKNHFETAWILGKMPRAEYISKAVFIKKGTVDPSNGFIVREDCYNLPISKLYEL